jgi:hypothetical protein
LLLACIGTGMGIGARPAHGQAAWLPTGAAVSVSSERFSDPLPLNDLMANRLAGLKARHGQSLIYLRDEARLSVQWAHASMGLVARQSATLTASRGAVQLVQDVTADGPPAQSYEAQVDMRVKGFAGYGVTLGWQDQWATSGLRWQVELQSLQLRRVLVRDITGWANFDAASSSYTTQLQSEQYNDHHRYPFQSDWGRQGWGLLGSAAVQWQATPSWQLQASVEDLGRLRWDRLPRETETLSTQVQQTDADGNLVYSPLLNGRNSNAAFSQRATASYKLGALWAWQPGREVELQWRRMDGVRSALPYSGLRLQGDAGWQLQAGWLWFERAAVLGFKSGPWQLQLAGDALDASARTRQLRLSWQQGW